MFRSVLNKDHNFHQQMLILFIDSIVPHTSCLGKPPPKGNHTPLINKVKRTKVLTIRPTNVQTRNLHQQMFRQSAKHERGSRERDPGPTQPAPHERHTRTSLSASDRQGYLYKFIVCFRYRGKWACTANSSNSAKLRA